MERATIVIKTIKDIVDKVPRDQLDVFLQDLKKHIFTCDSIVTMRKILPIGSITFDDSTLNRIDDSKNESHVQITFNP